MLLRAAVVAVKPSQLFPARKPSLPPQVCSVTARGLGRPPLQGCQQYSGYFLPLEMHTSATTAGAHFLFYGFSNASFL